MEQIRRYIYAVTQKLPQHQRADIDKEWQGLIEDMVEERVRDGADAESAMEEVLLELGQPTVLAAKYRGNRRYLISPEFYDSYLSVVKIVITSIAVSLTVVHVIEFILNPMQAMGQFATYPGSLFTAAVQGFAWVTIAFALIEYAGVKAEKMALEVKKEWHPSTLPPIPDRTSRITPSEPIAGIVFSVLFLVLFTFSLHLLGVVSFHEGRPLIVPLFNEGVFRGYLPFIWLLTALAIVRDCLKIITRKWTRNLLVYPIFFNIVSFIFTLIMFTNPEVWNARFVDGLLENRLLTAGSETFLLVKAVWNHRTQVIYIIAAFTLIDTINACVKGYRMKAGLRQTLHS